MSDVENVDSTPADGIPGSSAGADSVAPVDRPPADASGVPATPSEGASPDIGPDRYAHRRSEPEPDPLSQLLRLCHVPRWTTVPLTRPQSVAEHSYRVAAISFYLMHRLGLYATMAETIAEAIGHDAPEHATGDIPSTQKPVPVEDPSVPHQVGTYILKLADLLEAFTYLGNHGYRNDRRRQILDRYRESIIGQIETIMERFPATQSMQDLHQIVDEVIQICQEAA